MKLFESIDIETHNICNRKCGYCPVSLDMRGPAQIMPSELIDKILKELQAFNFKGRINLNLYNEPLLDDRLGAIAITIKKLLPGARLHLYSNGDYLDAASVTQLLSIGVYSIKITDHNPKPNPRLRLLMKAIGQRFVGRLSLHQFNASSALHNRGGSLDHAWTKKKTPTCWPAASPHAYVDFKGNMVSCCDDAFSATIFGNLATQSLIEIWESPAYVKFRTGLQQNKYYFEICAKCNVNKGKDVKLGTLVE